MADRTRIVIGTRKSRLALAQSELVAAAIRNAAPHLNVELLPIVTQGDIKLDKPVPQIGGKGLFTLELEQALLAGRIDLAVHSAKDLPADTPSGLDILCVPARAAPADVLVSPLGSSLHELPLGARVGTGSLRRQLQLVEVRPGLQCADIRGNVDTRVSKAMTGQYDAVVLAEAGLVRARLLDVPHVVLPLGQMLPAPGQAALAVQGRTEDAWLRDVLAPVNDPVTAACLQAERRLLRALELDCLMPFAALCQSRAGGLTMRIWLAHPDTHRSIRLEATASAAEPLVAELLRRIDQAGGREILAGCRRRKQA